MLNGKRTIRKRGFTLIELLVVISIIALLLSIMAPALKKAKDSAMRVVCCSQQKQWTTMAFSFAAEHKGKMPKAFRHSGEAPHGGFPMLIMINDVTSEKTNGKYDDYAKWEIHGTPYAILQNYGLTESILICPAQRWMPDWTGNPDFKKVLFAPLGSFDTAGWRRWVMQSYMFTAGARDEKMSTRTDINNYKVVAPYWERARDKALSNQVIVADTVMYIPPGSAWKKPKQFYFNHLGPREDIPGYQALGMADGSVQGRTSSYYGNGLQDDVTVPGMGDWSMRHFGYGPYFYWEGTGNKIMER